MPALCIPPPGCSGGIEEYCSEAGAAGAQTYAAPATGDINDADAAVAIPQPVLPSQSLVPSTGTTVFIVVPDTAKNRQWMKKFKSRWKSRLDQIEIWMVSYRIEIE